MRQRENKASTDDSRLLDTDELKTYLSLGRDNAVKLGDKCGARLRFGKRVVWDKKRIDAYLDELLGE